MSKVGREEEGCWGRGRKQGGRGRNLWYRLLTKLNLLNLYVHETVKQQNNDKISLYDCLNIADLIIFTKEYI